MLCSQDERVNRREGDYWSPSLINVTPLYCKAGKSNEVFIFSRTYMYEFCEWILLYVAFCTIVAIWQYRDRRKPEVGTMPYSYWRTSRLLYGTQYYKQYCTIHTFEQFGAGRDSNRVCLPLICEPQLVSGEPALYQTTTICCVIVVSMLYHLRHRLNIKPILGEFLILGCLGWCYFLKSWKLEKTNFLTTNTLFSEDIFKIVATWLENIACTISWK